MLVLVTGCAYSTRRHCVVAISFQWVDRISWKIQFCRHKCTLLFYSHYNKYACVRSPHEFHLETMNGQKWKFIVGFNNNNKNARKKYVFHIVACASCPAAKRSHFFSVIFCYFYFKSSYMLAIIEIFFFSYKVTFINSRSFILAYHNTHIFPEWTKHYKRFN